MRLVVYVCVTIGIVPPTVEVFATKKQAELFALAFKQQTGHTLTITQRELDIP